MTYHKSFLVLHRYLGLAAALPLILAGLSGAILVFEAELDRAMNQSYWTVQPHGQPLSWQSLIAAASQRYSTDPATIIRLPASPDQAGELGLKSGLSVSVDPYTGQILGARRRDQSPMTRIHQFHTRLLLGNTGRWITGISTFILLVLSLTGLLLWWRRKAFAIKWSAPWRRVNYNAHYALGIYFLLPWLVLGISGVAISFEAVLKPLPYWLTRSAPVDPPANLYSTPMPGAAPITIDAALASARTILPGAEVTIVFIPKPASPPNVKTPIASKTAVPKPPGVFTIYMKFPEDRTPAGRSRIAIDQFSGSPVWMVSSRTAPAGTKIWNLNRPIHTGDLFGWPTRLLACLASALLALQTLSGLWLWWPRRY